MNNNIIKEYYCKNIDGYESDNEQEEETHHNEFKIEEMPDIDISNYM